ncbi:hypothetical protein D3C87_1260780 [compost metagenome]
MKIAIRKNYFCLIGRDTFYLVCPFTAKLDGGLYGLNTRVHYQSFIEAKQLANKRFKSAQVIAVKGT